MAVFLAVRGFVPDKWPGVIDVTVPLGDSDGLVTSAPKLSEVVSDWSEPPNVYLFPPSSLARLFIGNGEEMCESGYLELPPELRDGKANVVFRSHQGVDSRRMSLGECVSFIHILGLASEGSGSICVDLDGPED
ncbi:MAG: hypothetical protein LBI99_04475 [Propionibacteriaceae bacterium]|nr:hypothetical protein [Propionibacteriaceae bacterium]